MGAIDDVRNVMQDFLAPEPRELRVRIDSVERHVEELQGSTQELKGSMEQFQQAERRAERRHEDMMFLIRQGQEV